MAEPVQQGIQRLGEEPEVAPVEQHLELSRALCAELLVVALDQTDDLGAGEELRREGGRGARRDLYGASRDVRLKRVLGTGHALTTGEAGFGRYGRVGHQGGSPILVGDAEPPAGLLERLRAAVLKDVGVADLLQPVRPDGADKPLVQDHPNAVERRQAVPGDQGEGIERDGAAALVLHLVAYGEQIVGVDRDGAPEDEPLAVVPNQRDRGLGRERALGLGAPERIAIGHRLRHALARTPAELGIVGMRRARRREQLHVGALGIHGLAVSGEHQIGDASALERERPPGARRIDAHPGAGVDRALPGRDDARVVGRRRCRTYLSRLIRLRGGACGRGWRCLLLGLGGLLLLEDTGLTLLLTRRRVEELPREQYRHRQNDGEHEVLLAFLVLHGCPEPDYSAESYARIPNAARRPSPVPAGTAICARARVAAPRRGPTPA